MATVLAYTSPARGHLFPLLPTLRELVARGHAVHVCTLAEEGGRATPLGISAWPIAEAIEARTIDDWQARSPLDGAKRALGTWLDRAPHEVADLRAAIARVRPDALIVDVNSWGALAAAEASGLPFAVFSPYFLALDLPGRPPFGLGLAPWPGALGAARDRAIHMVSGFAFRGLLGRLNALRASVGVPPVAHVGELALRGDRVIYFTAEAFEYPHGGWPEKVCFVGPGLWEPADTEGLADAAVASPPPPARRTALVTCSTEFQDDGRLVEVALEALASEDLDVVVTTAAVDPARFRPPANARVVRFAAHGPILRHAAVVVCHGGMGITQKALAAGVPVCVVPFGRDQNDVARHVELAGVGSSVPAGSLDVRRLRRAIHAAIGKAEGARRMSAAFAAAGGAGASASHVEALLGGVPRLAASA